MKQKNIALALLSLAAVGMMGLSSCETVKNAVSGIGEAIEGAGLNPFEPTDDVSAVVVHASTPEWQNSEHIAGKGRGEIRTEAGYHQSIIVKTKDGKQYKGSIVRSSYGACARTGQRGVATITQRSKVLRNFQGSH